MPPRHGCVRKDSGYTNVAFQGERRRRLFPWLFVSTYNPQIDEVVRGGQALQKPSAFWELCTICQMLNVEERQLDLLHPTAQDTGADDSSFQVASLLGLLCLRSGAGLPVVGTCISPS